MRKKILYLAVLFSAVSNAYAIEGLGNVRFKMTSKQVEAKGYVCAPAPEQSNKLLCQHPHLRTSEYGYVATNYKVIFGPDKKITQISADLQGLVSLEDYFELLRKVSIVFPIEDRAKAASSRGVFFRRVQRNASNVGASIAMFAGSPGIRSTTVSLSYIPSEYMLQMDQQAVKESKEKESKEKETKEVDNQSANN